MATPSFTVLSRATLGPASPGFDTACDGMEKPGLKAARGLLYLEVLGLLPGFGSLPPPGSPSPST